MSSNTDASAVAIWDARPYFLHSKPGKLVWKHEYVTRLERLTEDLQYGDIAIVYHSVSAYSIVQKAENPTFHTATTGISLNLYGVALIASFNSA